MSRIVYGINPVLELLRAGRERVDELTLAKGRKPNRLKDILALARAGGARIRYRPKEELTRLAGTKAHQGVVARVGRFAYRSLDDLLDMPGVELVVILDGIQDPRNLGAIARTALAAGAGAIIIPKDRAAGVTPVAVKASAGALEHLPVVRTTNLNQAAVKLKEAGYWLLGTGPSAPDSLYDLTDPPRPLAVVFGAEGRGVGRALMEKCDFAVNLPLAGGVDSLNASAAAAAVLFELRRRRLKQDA